MTTRGRHAGIAVAALVAACQPLPHPFEDDRPSAELVKVHNVASVSIAPIEGTPDEAAAKLAAELAKALLKRDIPASDKTTSLGSYQLYGRVVQSRPRDGNATVTALWRLYDADGLAVGERSVKAEASARDWEKAGTQPIEQLAQKSAEALAPLLDEEPTKPVASAGAEPDAGKVRVAINAIKGAPGDGGEALARAVAIVLKRQNLVIAEAGQKADLIVEGEVDISPVKPNKQHVKILWRVRRADGAEIGTVGQENDVPKGLLDGPWGDVAFNVAIAAGDGLLQLVARGLPEPKS